MDDLPRDLPQVVLLPGLFAGDWIWRDTIACLRQHGFGTVTLPDPIAVHDSSVDAFRQRVKQLLDRLDASNIILVGNSLGALIALDLAAHFPQRIRAVAVSGCPGLTETFDLGLGDLGKAKDVELAYGIGKRVIYDQARLTPEIIAQVLPVMRRQQSLLNLVRVLSSLRRYNIKPMLQQVHCPVLLLWGANDIVTPVIEWEGQLHLLKSVVLKKIPECGHAPMIEKPNEFNAELLDFLLPIKAALPGRTS